MTDFNINASFPAREIAPPPELPVASKKSRPQSFMRLVVWSILPMFLWYSAANGVAYYFTSKSQGIEIRQDALVIYSLATLYVVPWILTIITGFMAWGSALSVYGSGRGTIRAFGIFILQWLAVWAMTKASIHWHYVYFYTEQFYS